jgi:hypothetical protein
MCRAGGRRCPGNGGRGHGSEYDEDAARYVARAARIADTADVAGLMGGEKLANDNDLAAQAAARMAAERAADREQWQ